ncbi:argininosuccinate synthase [Aliikangiella coralliicola]|uniref:argininosuccinate synthase n=1 Tax=Aliikangiella coralliicola TaxID=2592383 RepID=A0A545UA78_9GAMM|nr:argininosuccinate synthase [Aliikangiella coralliicola]TQV86371.1 argininosuccinate synthase [Aliikangiella coralliicola]
MSHHNQTSIKSKDENADPNSDHQAGDNKIVLAFSGGLDTSFCVPYLTEQGYQVTTIFVDSGGVTQSEKQAIKQRAIELGATDHKEVSIADELWDKVIVPLIYSGHWYQNQYPLLCSDRYLIVEACLKLCDELGTKNFAHGCTGMGNDQVRFDLAVHCLGDYKIISPIREIQKKTSQVREYEKQYLLDKGFSVSDKVSSYSINENLLGATISGSEIDEWQQPDKASYVLTALPGHTENKPQLIKLTFSQGSLSALNGEPITDNYSGQKVMQQLNQLVGSYSIGRGIYTGDTTIGLKGRIVFEAPALHALNIAHTALEECVLSKAQNRFKSTIAEKWTELVYEGFFYEPLKYDLEAFLKSSQTQVSGTVTLQLSQGQLLAVAVESDNILKDSQSVYAQSASWNIEEALGFIKLFGKSSSLAAGLQTTQAQG